MYQVFVFLIFGSVFAQAVRTTIEFDSFSVCDTKIGKKTGADDDSACVPISLLNSLIISGEKTEKFLVDFVELSPLDSVQKIITHAEEFDKDVREEGMFFSQSLNILEKLNPELVKDLNLKRVNFKRLKDESGEDHLSRIYNLIHTSILNGFAPVIKIDGNRVKNENGENVWSWNRARHALTIQGIQSELGGDHSFLMLILDPDSGESSVVNVLNPQRHKHFGSWIIDEFKDDGTYKTIWSGDAELDYPLLPIQSGTLRMGSTSRNREWWARHEIVLSGGLLSVEPEKAME
jgi:hypothetical protein